MSIVLDCTEVSSNLTDRIANRLRNDIVSGAYQPETRLPNEQEIATSFLASLPTVRSALRRLVAEDLIYSKRGPRGGHFVNRPSVESANRLTGGVTSWLVRSGKISQADILEVLQIIGVSVIRLASERRSEADIAQLEQAILKMSDSSLSNSMFCASEIQFSRLIASTCGNGLLTLLNLVATSAYATAIRHKVFSFEERETIVGLAGDSLAAIRARQAKLGEARMISYVEFLRDILFADTASEAEYQRPVMFGEIRKQ